MGSTNHILSADNFNEQFMMVAWCLLNRPSCRGFVKKITQHFSHCAIPYFHPSLIYLIFHIEIADVEVMSALARQALFILFQQDYTSVVLVHFYVWVISLRANEKVCPNDVTNDVADADKFGFGRTSGVNFLIF